jgi:hypothetical protein
MANARGTVTWLAIITAFLAVLMAAMFYFGFYRNHVTSSKVGHVFAHVPGSVVPSVLSSVVLSMPDGTLQRVSLADFKKAV